MSKTISWRGKYESLWQIAHPEGWHSHFCQRSSVLTPCCSPGGLLILHDGLPYASQEVYAALGIRSNEDRLALIGRAYLAWGTAFVHRLLGSFAIVIYDQKSEVLFCYRDRLGEKPFMYSLLPSAFIFASTLAPVLEYPSIDRYINTNELGRYLKHGYISAPNTIFNHVKQLEPGCYLTFRAGKMELSRYWSITDAYKTQKRRKIRSYSSAKQELCDTLQDVIVRRCAGRHAGALLSGGIDSAIVVAQAQCAMGRAVHTFTAGFLEKEFNEAGCAEETAEHLRSDLNITWVMEEELMDSLRASVRFFDEPFGDTSQIPMMRVSSKAAQYFDLVLVGDGGDEVFLGYPYYRKLRWLQAFDWVSTLLHPLLLRLGMLGESNKNIKIFLANRDRKTKTQLSKGLGKDEIQSTLLRPIDSIHYPIEEGLPLRSWLRKRQCVDFQTSLLSCFTKIDRAAGGSFLEVTSPLSDHRLLELSFRFPLRFLIRFGVDKRILKDTLYAHVPKGFVNRTKRGFSIPSDRWIKNEQVQNLLDVCLEKDFITEQGLFDHTRLVALLREKKNARDIASFKWHYLLFQLWYAHRASTANPLSSNSPGIKRIQNYLRWV